jgi:hypothetical protein
MEGQLKNKVTKTCDYFLLPVPDLTDILGY